MTRFFEQSVHWIVSSSCTNVPCDLSARFLCQRFHAFLLEKQFGRHARSRWSFDKLDRNLEFEPKVFGKFFHCDHQWHRPQFDVCDGTWLSTPSVYWLFYTQKTTFHPLPEHHQLVPVAVSHLWMGLRGLFFKPGCQCMTTYAEDALDPTHTGTFVVSCNDLLFFLFGVSTTWFEYTAFAAIFAPELLTTTGIMAVLDNVWTATPATYMYYCFCYHPNTIPSLRFDQPHIFHTEQTNSPSKCLRSLRHNI